jgi:hypothetical protein
VTDGIANFFTSTIPNAAKQAADGVKGIATNVGASANTMFTGGATPYNPLLFGPGVGPLPAKVESNTRIQVLLPPGATANTSTEQTGGRPAEVNVGPSATVMP